MYHSFQSSKSSAVVKCGLISCLVYPEPLTFDNPLEDLERKIASAIHSDNINRQLSGKPIDYDEPENKATDSGTCGDNLEWFYYDNGLLEITGSGKMEDYSNYYQSVVSVPWHEYRSNIKNVKLSKSLKSIGGYAFYDCTGLTQITIPESVTSIGDDAFDGCTGLTSVTYNAINCSYYSVFKNCTNLTKVKIGEKVETIPAYAFRGCTGLTQITIPESVTSIGDAAFYGCTGLTQITIPESVTSIGGSAFYGCTGLTQITIPESVTSISDSTFFGCIGLTSITIPESVTSIGVRAFDGCSSLTCIAVNFNNKYYLSEFCNIDW